MTHLIKKLQYNQLNKLAYDIYQQNIAVGFWSNQDLLKLVDGPQKARVELIASKNKDSNWQKAGLKMQRSKIKNQNY